MSVDVATSTRITAAVGALGDLNTDIEQFGEPAPPRGRTSPYAGPAPRAWQREALAAWRSAGRRGVIEAVTGTGKTTVGVLAAAEALSRRERVIVLVPGVDLLEQWVRVLRRQVRGVRIGQLGGGQRDTLASHRIVVATVQSAASIGTVPSEAGALIIADEVHRYGTRVFAGALDEHYTARLGLTATYERSDLGKAVYLQPYFGGTVAGCDYDRALRDGILAEFRVGFVGVDLSPHELREYRDHADVLSKTRAALIAGHGCPSRPFGEFMKRVAVLSRGGDYDDGAQLARRYLSAFAGRRALTAECAAKKLVVRDLASVLHRAGRGLVFAETLSSVSSLTTLLRSRDVKASAYTSELSRYERTRAMAAFSAGDTRVLVAPRVLDEGIDVPEADTAVIVSASSSRRQMVQRMGRVVRPKVDGRKAHFFVVYAKGTHEDPGEGAHEAFVDEMTQVAHESYVFPEGAEEADFLQWFLDGRPETWVPPGTTQGRVVDDREDDSDLGSFPLQDRVTGEESGFCMGCADHVRSVASSLNELGLCRSCAAPDAAEQECPVCEGGATAAGSQWVDGYLQWRMCPDCEDTKLGRLGFRVWSQDVSLGT